MVGGKLFHNIGFTSHNTAPVTAPRPSRQQAPYRHRTGHRSLIQHVGTLLTIMSSEIKFNGVKFYSLFLQLTHVLIYTLFIGLGEYFGKYCFSDFGFLGKQFKHLDKKWWNFHKFSWNYCKICLKLAKFSKIFLKFCYMSLIFG